MTVVIVVTATVDGKELREDVTITVEDGSSTARDTPILPRILGGAG